MNFTEAIGTVWSKYGDFNGRARRSEYWWWQLAIGVVVYVPYFFALFTAEEDFQGHIQIEGLTLWLLLLAGVVFLICLVPSLAVTVRRLHDCNYHGALILLSLIPIGSIVVFVFTVMDGTDGPNTYGPDPKADERWRPPAS